MNLIISGVLKMKRVLFFVIFNIFFNGFLFSTEKNIKELKKLFLEQNHVVLAQEPLGVLISNTFEQMDLLEKSKAPFLEYLRLSAFNDILTVKTDDTFILKIQSIVTAQLYEIFFQQLIDHSNSFLQQTTKVLEYWHKPFLKKSDHVIFLEEARDQQAYWLGIASFAVFQLKSIKNIADIDNVLFKIVQSMGFEFEIKSRRIAYDHLLALHSRVLQDKEYVLRMLSEHAIPNHFVRNDKAYIILLMTAALGYCFYSEKKSEVCNYAEKINGALSKAWQSIFDSLKGLKRAIWNDIEIDIKEIELNMQEMEVPKAPGLFGFSLLSYWEFFRQLAEPVVHNHNEVIQALKDTEHNYNQIANGLKDVAKRQQVNYYLSSLVPVFMLTYAGYRFQKSSRDLYNNDYYFKPMRKLIHAIDCECSKRFHFVSKEMFSSVGMIQFYVSQLMLYIDCLNDQEKLILEKDIQQLQSFEYSAEQKQKVVDRMYHIYSFLANKCE
ncbi:hypothetical protein HYV11_03320 [Candidatus Dependentiae bacterium]|nr:hypothetical protein [Candidatus Dependentiae bacterium]